MALLRSKPADPVEVIIPRLIDDPEFARATELLGSFTARQARLEREKARLELEAHFRGRPASEDPIFDRETRKRLLALQAEPQISAESSMPNGAVRAPSTNSAITLGLQILAGEPAPPELDYRAKILAVERQIAVIHAAVCAQTEIRDTIAADLTSRYTKQIKPAWDALQVELYRAAQELARNTRRVREFRAAISAAGIRPRDDILAMPNVRAPLMLGDETEYDSEISGWRRILERLGIL